MIDWLQDKLDEVGFDVIFMTQKKKPLVTTIRLDAAVVAKLDKAAKADNRSRSSLLQKIIAEWVKVSK